MECSSEYVQNLLYYYHFVQFYIFTFMNALVYMLQHFAFHWGQTSFFWRVIYLLTPKGSKATLKQDIDIYLHGSLNIQWNMDRFRVEK